MFYINTLTFLLVSRFVINQFRRNNPEITDKIYLFLASVALMLLTGLRGSKVGADTRGYIRNFLEMDGFSWKFALSEKSGRFESGYKLWTKLVGAITDSEVVFLVCSAALFALFLGIYINKNSKNRFLSIILYYTVSGFSFQLSGIRQALAMAIVLVSFDFIKERKFFRFLIIVFLASLFHKSAFAVIPMYFIAHIKMNFKNFLIFITTGILIWAFKLPLLDFANNVLGYEKSAIGFEGGAVYVVAMYSITILASYIYMNLLLKDEKNVVFFNITFFSLFIYILRYYVQIAERISFYYQFAFIILLPNVVESVEDDKTRRFLRVCVVVLSCALFVYRCIRGMENSFYYHFYWQN